MYLIGEQCHLGLKHEEQDQRGGGHGRGGREHHGAIPSDELAGAVRQVVAPRGNRSSVEMTPYVLRHGRDG
jgi:hypothetical protein